MHFGYSFTSPDVVRALMAARRRGMDVRVMVNVTERATAAQQSQLGGDKPGR